MTQQLSKWSHRHNRSVYSPVWKKSSEVYIIIIIIKTSSTGLSVEKNVLICFYNPTSTCATEKWKNTMQGSNQQLTAPLDQSNVPVSNTVCIYIYIYNDGHSTCKPGSDGNTFRIWRNNNLTITLPCGTTGTTLTSLHPQPSTVTCCDRFDISCVSIENAEPPIPTEQRIPWEYPIKG